MASINGISIKKITRFKDHEGCTIAQGDIYYKNKKQGWWSQDSWGGPDQFGFDEAALDDEVNKYKNSSYVEDKYRDLINLELLIYDLLLLTDKETAYKKGVKKGYSTYVCADDGYHYSGYYTNSKEPTKDKFYKTFVKECEKTFFKDKSVNIEIFNSLDDFKIVC